MEKRRQKQRIRNPQQTRAKLLQATVDLVAEKGAEALSVKAVAHAANVSRGVAYQHFEDREHLLREARKWLSDRLLESVANVESSSMEEQVLHVAKLVLGNREASRLWMADALAGKALDTDHPLHKGVTRTLEQFRTSGKTHKDIDVEILSAIMLGVVAMLLMLGQRHEGAAAGDTARRFTAEWTRILRHGIFLDGRQNAADGDPPAVARRLRPKAASRFKDKARS